MGMPMAMHDLKYLKIMVYLLAYPQCRYTFKHIFNERPYFHFPNQIHHYICRNSNTQDTTMFINWQRKQKEDQFLHQKLIFSGFQCLLTSLYASRLHLNIPRPLNTIGLCANPSENRICICNFTGIKYHLVP